MIQRLANFIGTLTIPTKRDEIAVAGQIAVTILDDDTPVKDYTLTSIIENRIATVNVRDFATLLISRSSDTIDEGSIANFKVTATNNPVINPTDQLRVHFTPTATDTNFLHTNYPSGSSTYLDLEFEQDDKDDENSTWSATLPIQLRERDNIDTINGDILVTLDTPNGANYYAPSPNNADTITILDDDTPMISISNAELTYNGNVAEFTLTSDIQTTQTHTLLVKAKNNEGSFLGADFTNDVEKEIMNVEFSQTSPFTYTLNIPTKVDEQSETGEIVVEIFTNSISDTYNIDDDNNTAMVMVHKKTTLSISAPEDAVNEGATLNFVVTSNYEPVEVIHVKYSVMEVENNIRFTAPDIIFGSQNPFPLEFINSDPTNPNATWVANLPIPLRPQDNIDSVNGVISVTLDQPSATDNYFIADEPNDRDSAAINDIDVPQVSIIDKVRIFASQDAELTLTSDIESVHSHLILVRASNSAGFNFLDTTEFENGVVRPIENVRFTRPEGTTEPFTYTFSVPTIVDNSEPYGSISVELLENTVADTYDVNIENSVGAIIVSTLPVLSIAPLNPEVNEGDDLIFIVTSTEDPGMEGLIVNYTINEDENSFYRHSTVTTGSQDPINLTFSQADSTDITSPWTAEIRVQLRDRDQIDAINGAITLVLNVDSATETSYVVADSPANEATATIRDLDVPVFSISDAPETVAGQAATFTITSNIQSTQPHTLIVLPKNESGEFLNTDVGGESEVNRIISDVNFTQAPPYTYSLAISTKEDNSNPSGLISVKLVENTEANTYNIAETPTDTATVGITNFGDDIPTLSISDSNPSQQREGSMGDNNRLTFNVTLSKAVDFPITVNFAVSDYEGQLSPAIIDEDFTLEDGILVIPAGETTGSISVTIIGDDVFEPNEAFIISISLARNSSIEIIKNTGIGTIVNDDEEPVIPRTIGEPEISITNNQGSITEGEVAIFNISALRPDEHTAEINVQISVVEVGSFIGWRVPRVVIIPANVDSFNLEISTMDDTNHEPDGGRITVNIERSDNNYTIAQSNPSASVNVEDTGDQPDATPLPRISVAQTAVDSILNRFIPASSTSRSAITESIFHEQPTISVFASDLAISEGESAMFDIVASW